MFPMQDPLDDIYTGVLGICWGMLYARAWQAPKIFPGPTISHSLKYLIFGTVYGVGSSMLMAAAWHTKSGRVHRPDAKGLSVLTVWSVAMSAFFVWANSSAPEVARWPYHSALICRMYWASIAVTNLVYMLIFTLVPSAPALSWVRNSLVIAWVVISCMISWAVRVRLLKHVQSQSVPKRGHTSTDEDGSGGIGQRRLPEESEHIKDADYTWLCIRRDDLPGSVKGAFQHTGLV
jgi:hypothetical protein